jgi:hypothetical protein
MGLNKRYSNTIYDRKAIKRTDADADHHTLT